jgi:hypothetical protein
LNPILDFVFVLIASGHLNVYSSNSGKFERTLILKDYLNTLDIQKILDLYTQKYTDIHRYPHDNEAINQFSSKTHGVLEYNSRYLKNFLFGMENSKAKNIDNDFKILAERFGDIERQSFYKKDNPHVSWLFHYTRDVIFASRFKKKGVAFLNYVLDTAVTDEERSGQNAHILIINPKTLNEKPQ